jgi:hypothetical protein
MLIKHPDSHVDHGLTEAQLSHLFERFADHEGFFLETITLPPELGTVPCNLYGPLVGDPAIREDEVTYARRGDRAWDSRLIDLPPRQQHEVTVIAGPHDGHPCVLYTAFGGPTAPQEPSDPGCKDPVASAAFWREHALAR